MCDPFDTPKCQLWSDERSQIALQEKKGRKYIGHNKDKKLISNFELDGCLVKSDKLKKADFIFLICDEKKAYIVELKGKNLNQAIQQINSSLDVLLGKLNSYRPIYGRIILSATRPKLLGVEIARLQRRFKMLGGNLIYRTRIFEENL